MIDRTITCSRCGFENPAAMKFCGGCGSQLALAPAEEERKEVAVLFADICDFTALVASHDPEETKEKIDGCLKVIAERVAAYGGVVEKFIGDAVVAIFGVPAAHENDAERAVRSALAVFDEVDRYGRAVGLELRLRVGIHCGEVIASTHDRVAGHEHGIFGDTVNVASRLESTGEAGAAVVSGAVYRKTREFFDYQEMAPVKAKGIDRPLSRYRLVGEKAVRGKVRGVRGIRAPMVGRAAELARLADAYRAAARGAGGKVAGVLGEPGVGKTRLVEELLLAAEAEESAPTVLHGRCLGYAGAQSYLPFAQIIRNAAGIPENAPPAEMRAQLTAAVETLFGGTAWGEIDVVDVLSQVLALGGGDGAAGGRDTEQMRQQIAGAVEEYLRRLTARRPAIIVVEDVHWADMATFSLLEQLADAVSDCRCLLILNSRPPDEYGAGPRWLFERLATKPNADLIVVHDLTADESRELVQRLLAVEHISPAARDFIVARSGGNPFFVEEIIKTLIEKGVLEQRGDTWYAVREVVETDIPDSIEGVLRSRLDLLPSRQKQVIQRASVVGRIFWEKIVSELVAQAVAESLTDLERRDLIRQRLESIFADDREYIFKHALLHETAYNTMLHRVRRDLHLKTAAWIEKSYADRIDAYLSLVAHHYEEGGAREKAAEYYVLAAAQAAALFANDDAQKLYAKAVVCTNRPDILRRAYLGWGEVCARTGANDEALEHFESARPYGATALEDAEVFLQFADVYEKMSAYAKSFEYLKWADELLKDQPPSLVRCWVMAKTGWIYYLRDDLDEALRIEREAETAVAAFPEGTTDADLCRARIFNIIAGLLRRKGDPEPARPYYRRALSLYESHRELGGVASILNNSAILDWNDGDLGTALAGLLRSMNLEKQIGRLFGEAVCCCNVGGIYADAGDYETARRYFEHYLELNAKIGNRLGDGYAYGGLGRVAEETGDPGQAEVNYRRAIAVFEEVGAAIHARDFGLVLAGLYAAMGREAEARVLLDDYRQAGAEDDTLLEAEVLVAARIARRRPLAESEKAAARELVARAEAQKAEPDAALSRLEQAVVLAELCAAVDDRTKGDSYLARAGEIAGHMASHLRDADMAAGLKERLRRLFPLLTPVLSE